MIQWLGLGALTAGAQIQSLLGIESLQAVQHGPKTKQNKKILKCHLLNIYYVLPTAADAEYMAVNKIGKILLGETDDKPNK